jgi:hypothetical protein
MFKLVLKVLEYIQVFKFLSLCIQNIVTGKIFDSKIIIKLFFLQTLVENVTKAFKKTAW